MVLKFRAFSQDILSKTKSSTIQNIKGNNNVTELY